MNNILRNKAEEMLSQFIERIPDEVPNHTAKQIAKNLITLCINEINSIDGIHIGVKDYYDAVHKELLKL